MGVAPPIDLRPLVEKIFATVRAHELDGLGRYRRYGLLQESGTAPLAPDAQAVAAAASILYSIGRFPADAAQRSAFVSTLRAMQNPRSGLFGGSAQDAMHTTARCVAALELFDVGPTHPISALQPYATAEAIRGFLDGLNWQGEPLAESVRATALYTILKLTDAADAAWEDAYFEWLWENSDPATGLWRRGQLAGAVGDGTFPRLAAAFYFLSTHEYARRRLRYPTPLLRTALAYWRESGEWLVEQIGFDALAWVYCVTRAGRQATDPYFEGRWELARFLESHVRFLMGLDHERHEQWNDLHALSGTVSCLAELQQALPGTVRTEKPLRQVLDRRPF